MQQLRVLYGMSDMTFAISVGFGSRSSSIEAGSHNHRYLTISGDNKVELIVFVILFVVICVCCGEWLWQSHGEEPQRHQESVGHLTAGIPSPNKAEAREDLERQLKMTHFNEQDSGKYCAICLNVMKEGDRVANSSDPDCRHLFHADCIVDWLVKHQDCPECRRCFLNAKE